MWQAECTITVSGVLHFLFFFFVVDRQISDYTCHIVDSDRKQKVHVVRIRSGLTLMVWLKFSLLTYF